MIFTRGNVTIITQEDPNHKDPLPEIGKTYYAYDDGKVRPSREYQVTIDRLVENIEELPDGIYEAWSEEANECYWLFNEESDYIVIAHVENEVQEECYFVRTWGGHWHSISHENAISGDNLALDVTGENRAYVVKEWGESNE